MLTWWACAATSADARQVTDTARKAAVESDPITCWWKTERSAVHVGEQFTLTLTCAVIETDTVRVVTDADRLDPAALDLAPFEVVGGTRHRDIEAPPRRYFQYSYSLRLLGDELFGRDVDIPQVAITYNIESSGVTGTRGRDQLYLLPRLPVRLLSLVPLTATDIQDATRVSFDDIDRRAFRATGELTAAAVFFTFAAAVAVLGVARAVRPRVARAAAVPSLLSSTKILRRCIRDAVTLKSETRSTGWTADRTRDALAVCRLAGSLALGRTVAQRVVERSAAAEDGQLAMRKSRLSAQRVLVSGATTASAIESRLAGPHDETMNADLRVALAELSEPLAVFATARYSRGGDLDAPALDAALETGLRGLRRLYAMQQWRARTATAAAQATDRVKGILWDR